MKKVSVSRLRELVADPDVDRKELLEYVEIVPGKHATDFSLKINPDRVDVAGMDEALEADLAKPLDCLNNTARDRRQSIFKRRIKKADHPPVLVSEGDSWFQFPIVVDVVVDHLFEDYLIWSVGAAGDTAENMVFGPKEKYGCEYLAEIQRQGEHVKGFLFSAAGNDVIGEDASGDPVLLNILKDFNGDVTDIEGHINFDLLNEKIGDIEKAYKEVIKSVHGEFKKIPIFIHGYDYVFPYPWGDDDPRNPRYVSNDNWLGKPLNERNIVDQGLRRGITTYLINRLYELLEEIAGDSSKTQVWLVDCRGAMPEVSDWNDEIHGTDEGFAKVAERFRPVIEKALAAQSA